MQSNLITGFTQNLNQQIIENSQQTTEQLKQELKLLDIKRTNIFFKPILNKKKNIKIPSEVNFLSRILRNKDFYEKLECAKLSGLKKILATELKELIKIDTFYCNGSHVADINQLISKAKSTKSAKFIENAFRNINYWLHKLIILLKDFKYMYKNHPTEQIVSKEALTLKLNECLVELDKCWNGFGSRLSHLYETLSSIQQGLIGEIYAIRKGLYKESIITVINSIKKDKNYRYLAMEEIHIYNKLYNHMAEKLGFASVKDPSMPNIFDDKFLNKLRDLVIVDISRAAITRRFAEQAHEELSTCLGKIRLRDWLTTNKKDADLNINIDILDTLVFAPINILFNATNEAKLTINNILDIIDVNKNVEYSLSRSKEKLHQWLANALMPNSQKVLVANIYDQQTKKYLSIASIDDIFFWVFEQHIYQDEITECKFESENHITLNLSHIQQIDFINFTGVNTNIGLSLLEQPKKIEVSISLVTQALEQTNNIYSIIDFFANSDVIEVLDSLPSLQKIADKIMFNKLSNKSYKEYFIDEIKKYYFIEKKAILTKNIVSFFVKYNILTQGVELNLIKQGINIKEVLRDALDEFNFILKYLAQLSADDLKNLITTENRQQLFLKSIETNNIKLQHKLLQTNYYNEDTTPLSIAIIDKNTAQVKFLLTLDDIHINKETLYYLFVDNHDEIYDLVTTYILNNIDKFTNQQLISILEAKNIFGDPGIFRACEQGNFALVKKYFEFILSIQKLSDKEKLFLIKVTDKNNLCWPFYDIKKLIESKTIKEYIREYMRLVSSFC